MISNTHNSLQGRRLLALVLAITAACTWTVPAAAAEPIGNGVAPVFDEAYYATLDYYGNLKEGSVVKSYILNGAESLTDYGTYDEVMNLTDGTVPAIGGDTTTFSFGTAAPTHFYFEGRTTRPFESLPWTIAMHYTLNGVPTKAEELAGKTGVVEIMIDIVPNEGASQYARNNYTLEAMAIFNQDDILSLEAPGAQVQLIGNLRAVLFLALPGEEQHFTIRVGAEDFSFEGMTFLMVPATLSQLEQIADISQKKDELEDDYHKLSGSLDELLSSMNNMTGSLYASANGLDALNQARDTFSSGKGVLYDGTDQLKGDLQKLSQLLDPVAGQVQALSQMVTDSKATLNTMTDTALSLREQLGDLEDALENLEDGTGDVQRLLDTAADMKGSLRLLRQALEGISGEGGGGEPGTEIPSSRVLVKKVKALHKAYETADLESFMSQMLIINGTADTSAQADALAAQLMQLAGIPEGAIGSLTPEQQAYWKNAQSLKSLRDYAQSGATFQQFCEKLPGVTKAQAKQMNDLWIVYSSGKLDGKALVDVTEDPLVLSASLLQNDPAQEASAQDNASAGEKAGAAGESGDSAAEKAGEAAASGTAADMTLDTVPAGAAPDAPQAENGNSGDAAGTADQPREPDAPAGGDSDGESGSVGGAAVDLITEGLDSTLAAINGIKNELASVMKSVASPTASLLGDLEKLCSRLDDVTDLLDDAGNLTAALRRSSHKLRNILTDADALRKTLNAYEPTLQESLKTVGELSVTTSSTVRDAVSLIDSAEDLLRRSGAQLDDGTKKTLQGLSSVLRRTAEVMATSGSIQNSKNAMTDIIEDLWNDHTGDIDNLLMMDATAQAESLTDSRNGTPQSVQVLIRSQEIREEEPEEKEHPKQAADQGTFWDRVGQMFRDFWAAITGIFH